MFEIGRMCLKVAGREAGKYCVVVKRIDENLVLVTGPKSVTQVKRRKCNVTHLEPLKESIRISADASDEEVISAYEEASLFTKLDLPRPGQKPTYQEEAAPEKKAPKAKKAKKEE